MRVDFPAPFSPTMACTSPRPTRSSMSRLATTPGKRLVIPRSSTASGATVCPAAPAGPSPVTPVAAMVGLSFGCGHGCAAHVHSSAWVTGSSVVPDRRHDVAPRRPRGEPAPETGGADGVWSTTAGPGLCPDPPSVDPDHADPSEGPAYPLTGGAGPGARPR